MERLEAEGQDDGNRLNDLRRLPDSTRRRESECRERVLAARSLGTLCWRRRPQRHLFLLLLDGIHPLAIYENMTEKSKRPVVL